MFEPKGVPKVHIDESANTENLNENTLTTNTEGSDVLPNPTDSVEANTDVPHISPENVMDKSGSGALTFDGTEIAHEHIVGNGKMLILDDKFQDGQQYRSARAEFARVFEKMAKVEGVGKAPIAIQFEGGKIYIVSGVGGNPNSLEVLLNGKKIATGLLDQNGAKVKLLNTPGIKGGLFSADTVYEKAFKFAKPVIKTLKMNQ